MPAGVGRAADVVVSYQATLDDFAESALGKPTSTAWRRGTAPALSLAMSLFWWGYVFYITRGEDVATVVRPAGDLSDRARVMAVALAPLLVGLPLSLSAVFRIGLGRTPDPWGPKADPRLQASGRVVGLKLIWITLLMVGCVVGFFAWNTFSGTDAFDRLLALSALFYAMAMSGVFALLYRTVGIARLWQRQPREQLPRTMEAGEDGVVFDDPLARSAYRWAAFAGYKETPNLILLYTSIASVYIVPKRAFAADPAALARFKGLVSTHVPHGFFLPGGQVGFSVTPAQPAPV